MTSKDDNPVLADSYARSNVFLMMRFQKTKQQKEISDAISSVLAGYYLNPIRADSRHYQNELWANVKSCMDASDYGIAVFEQIDMPDINPNVSLELGYMIAQRKKMLIAKRKKSPGAPV
jgi:nucleoside 2-deoxyribosyltransferase